MASVFDITLAAAAVYAESLLQLAEEAGKAEEIGAELRQLRDLWHSDPSFASMMSSVAIEMTARRHSLRKVFGADRVSPLVLNLLLVLNDRGRAMILPAVCDAYRSLLDQRMEREEVHVTTVQPLNDQQRNALRTQIKKLTGHEADFHEYVDPQILGGIRVRVGDRMYDLSVRQKLRDMRSTLLASGERRLSEGISRFVTEGLRQ
ncbi:MAG TPA: ATP synthase F1 subunit delta [Phycisphaerae bacterium]|nr:ATP synthase F1 subunit delta [Phycisphaerae bacterium]